MTLQNLFPTVGDKLSALSIVLFLLASPFLFRLLRPMNQKSEQEIQADEAVATKEWLESEGHLKVIAHEIRSMRNAWITSPQFSAWMEGKGERPKNHRFYTSKAYVEEGIVAMVLAVNMESLVGIVYEEEKKEIADKLITILTGAGVNVARRSRQGKVSEWKLLGEAFDNESST